MNICPLHPRQVEAVKWMAHGKSAEETAVIMGISHRTVQSHLANAKEAIGVHKNTVLAATAVREGWIA